MTVWWADDYGLSEKVTHEIDKAIKSKRIIGYSILATHISIKNSHKNRIDTSFHVNLVEGSPVSNLGSVKSLVNSKGEFYGLPYFVVRALLGLVDIDELRTEIYAQYDKLISLGYKITNVDTHQHLQAVAIVERVIAEIARQKKLKIRDYNVVSTYTFRARICLLAFQFANLISKLVIGKLPKKSGKNTTQDQEIIFLSWEGPGIQRNTFSRGKSERIYIYHPGSSYDKVSSYKNLK